MTPDLTALAREALEDEEAWTRERMLAQGYLDAIKERDEMVAAVINGPLAGKSAHDEIVSLRAGAYAADARDEIKRLTACLATANGNHEEFERRWYLATDERDAARAEVARLKARRHNGREWKIARGYLEARAEVERLRKLLGEARDEIREAWSNVESTYRRDKYEDTELANRIDAALSGSRET